MIQYLSSREGRDKIPNETNIVGKGNKIHGKRNSTFYNAAQIFSKLLLLSYAMLLH